MERHHYRAKNDPNSHWKVWNRKDNFNQQLQHAKLGIECENDSGGATTAIHSHGNDVEGVQIEIILFDTPGMGMPDRDEKHVLLICKR